MDAFGGLIDAPAENAKDSPADVLARGMVAWAASDSPWTSLVDEAKFGAVRAKAREIAPPMILSSHLPVAENSTDQFVDLLSSVPRAEHTPPPDQALFSQIVAELTAPAAG